ncbi:hypothetical protein GQ543_02730 [candidate division WOR-3 bacterium]|nr:hypothetical protein [candidate division WOR-3 bacterium]
MIDDRYHLPILKILWTILLGGLAIYIVFFIIESIILINYPYQISYGEGFILNQAVIISQGQSIYQDITNYPYLVGNYPPVYPFLCALFVKIFGVSFAPGRFISFIAVILSGFLIYIILKENRRLQKGSFKESIVISALFFLASPYIFYTYPLYRVDALALLFSLAGLYFVFKFENRKSVYFSIPFFILALYTKQSFIAAPIASLIYLTFKNIKRGIIYFIFLSLVYVSIFLLLNNLTGGQYCLHNFTYNANAFSILFAIRMCVSALQIHAILFTFAFAYIIHIIIRKKLSLFAIYLIITALMAISIGKIGSGINYFGELVACSCIILGIFLNETEFTNKESKNILIVTGLLLQLILFAHMPYLTGHTPTNTDKKNAEKISLEIINTPGSILSEDGGLLVVNRRQILFQPFVFTQLARQNLWDQGKFVADITEKRFSLIILTFNINYEIDKERLTEEMAEAIRRSYYSEEKIGDYYIYRPSQ